MDGAAAIFDGVADVLGDSDRGAISLLISASTDGKDSAAKQLVHQNIDQSLLEARTRGFS